MPDFNGLGLHLGNLSRLSNARSRSISPENFTGEPGRGGMATDGTGTGPARDLGQGWKVSPSVEIDSGENFVLAEIQRGGAIQQIWITVVGTQKRDLILRMYWDDQVNPSVEVPIGDFFCNGLENYAHVSSLPICVNPGQAFNSFWEMPYRKNARITLENRDPQRKAHVYYQINYAETDVPDECAYFHAQFRRSNPVQEGLHPLLDNVSGRGHYVGTYMTWGVKSSGWWGEGEIKFFIDGDTEFPTICGTGTEDYFLGSHNFDVAAAVRGKGIKNAYTAYTTAYAGLPEVQLPDGVYQSQQRFGMYRWHIADPIRFEERLAVNIQALGWRGALEGHEGKEMRYLPLQDDVSSVAVWYQTLPTASFPTLPDRDFLELN
ncbi:MAG: DUF2961 domain-containing protein [Gammaproteobacteria bacterium]|nr:DUF2961 domain-containing protein [Gammaproteobacteria bacterium]